MSKPYIHAMSSAKKFGGVWEDYMPIHELMDSSKAVIADNRHRALTHNSWFISTILPKIFGEVFRRPSDGRTVSTRDIAEQHVLEDYKMKFIPSASDFLTKIPFSDWMQNGQKGYPDSYQELQLQKKNKKVEDLNLEEGLEEQFINNNQRRRRGGNMGPGSLIVD